MVEIDRQNDSSISFGPSVKVSTFVARNITQGNPYTLSPIRPSFALKFLRHPQEVPRLARFQQENPAQLTAFDDSKLKDLPRQGVDLPPRIYEWLNHTIPTGESITDRIRRELREDDVKYVSVINAYFEKVAILGPQTDLSNKLYGINLYSLLGGFNIEGETKSRSVNLAGRFDEVRTSDTADNIVRIRQKSGRPTTTDAIYLGLDYIAYLAVNKKKGSLPLGPDLSVFNLVDGESYVLGIYSDSFFREIINALNFSDLALRAGYYPKDFEDGFVNIHSTQEAINSKNVVLTNNQKTKQKLTAEEAFERAQNCIKRIRGLLPDTHSLFGFYQVKPSG
jgi:hypothetical protein